MISMPQIQSIRRMRRNGESIASIARKQHVSEPTVRKYLRMDDLSEKPPVRKRRGSVIDPYLPLIEQWLAEDRGNWRKQRHTATRIWERLRDEHGAAPGEAFSHLAFMVPAGDPSAMSNEWLEPVCVQ